MAENYESLTQKTSDLIRRMPAGIYLDHDMISLTHKGFRYDISRSSLGGCSVSVFRERGAFSQLLHEMFTKRSYDEEIFFCELPRMRFRRIYMQALRNNIVREGIRNRGDLPSLERSLD